jgi:hypothetical protein
MAELAEIERMLDFLGGALVRSREEVERKQRKRREASKQRLETA